MQRIHAVIEGVRPVYAAATLQRGQPEAEASIGRRMPTELNPSSRIDLVTYS